MTHTKKINNKIIIYIKGEQRCGMSTLNIQLAKEMNKAYRRLKENENKRLHL